MWMSGYYDRRRTVKSMRQQKVEQSDPRTQSDVDAWFLMLTDVLPISRLDWAFAGFSESKALADSKGSHAVLSTWHHWVDSRAAYAETVKDEGEMSPQGDGRTMERGRMVNPSTGRMTDYEECWKDVEPIATTAGPQRDTEEETKKVCVVLQLHDDANQARGMVVRVGHFCEGLVRVGEVISLERWKWGERGGWKRQARIGDLWLPCGVVLEGEQKLKMGGEVRYGDFLWKVVEMSEF